MARLTEEQWQEVRDKWESDNDRTGYVWLLSEIEFSVSESAIRKRAKKEAWEKAKKKVRAKVRRAPIRRTLSDQAETEQEEPGRGRPTLFKESYVDQVYRLALLGLTDAEMAKIFGVTEQTLNNWKPEHPDFFESMTKGKEIADSDVAASLYERACGYTHDAVHFSMWAGKVTETTYDKHYPPETAAAKMWLTNRQPHLWRNKVEVKQEITDPFPPVEVLDAITARAMVEIAERQKALLEERAKLNLDIQPLLEGELVDE